MSDNNFSAMLSGMILGGLAGYAFGVLYAPKEGEVLRGELKEKYKEKEKLAEEAIKEFMVKEEGELERIKDRVKEMISEWEGEFDSAKDKVKDEYTSQKDRLLQELEKLEFAFETGKKAYSAGPVMEEEPVKPKARTPRTKTTSRRRPTKKAPGTGDNA